MELQDCAAWLNAHDRYLLITHRRPDGDTLGSAAALCHALRRLGKTAHLYVNTEVTETYLPFVESYFAPAGYEAETFVSVDVADTRMLPPDYAGRVDLRLDHHLTESKMSPLNVVWSSKAACGELILALIDVLCGGIDKAEADLLYMAVSTDTGCFCYANTHADTFAAASRLLEAGADLPRLNKILFRTKSRAKLALEGMVFSSLRSYRDCAINVAVITLDMMERSGATEDDCDDLASLAGLVKGNRVSITVRELSSDPSLSKVSLRTDGSVDASRVCAGFGGGGHKMAAGCELPMAPSGTAEAIRLAVEAVWA